MSQKLQWWILQNQASKPSLKTEPLKNLSYINFNERVNNLSLLKIDDNYNARLFYALLTIKSQCETNSNILLNSLNNHNQFKRILLECCKIYSFRNYLIEFINEIIFEFETSTDDKLTYLNFLDEIDESRIPTESEALELDAWEFSTDESEFITTSFKKPEYQFSLDKKSKSWEESWAEFEEKLSLKAENNSSLIESDKKNRTTWNQNKTFNLKIQTNNESNEKLISPIFVEKKEKEKEDANYSDLKNTKLFPKTKQNTVRKTKPKLSKEEKIETLKEDRHKKKNTRTTRHNNKLIKDAFESIGLKYSEKYNLDLTIPQIKIDSSINKNMWAIISPIFDEKKPPYIYKAYYCFLDNINSQKGWMLIHKIKTNMTELMTLIRNRKFEQFKWKLFNIQRNVELHYSKKGFALNKDNTLWTIKKKVITSRWTSDEHKEKTPAVKLLSKYKQIGIKTGGWRGLMALDIDLHKIKSAKLRKKIFQAVLKFLQDCNIPFYVKTQSGGIHIYIRCLEKMKSCNFYFKDDNGNMIHIGEFLADGKQFISPLSENREIVWDSKETPFEELFEFKTEKVLNEGFSNYGFFLGSPKNEGKLIESNKTSKETREVKKVSSKSTLKPVCEKNIIILPKTPIPIIFKSSKWSKERSQPSEHVRIFYYRKDDKAKKERSFIIDKGQTWRFKQFKKLMEYAISEKAINILMVEGEKGRDYRFFEEFLTSEKFDKNSRKAIDLATISDEIRTKKMNYENELWTEEINLSNQRVYEKLYGKWLISVSWENIEKVWEIIKNAMRNNDLTVGSVKVSNRIEWTKNKNGSICVYTYRNDIDLVRGQLRKLGFTEPLCYKDNVASGRSLKGCWSHERCEKKISDYKSSLINQDINENIKIPSIKESKYWKSIRSESNKREEEVFGKWIIFSPWNKVDEDWKKISNAIENNLLTVSSVKVVKKKNYKGNKNKKASICIYTFKDNIQIVKEQLNDLGFTDALYETNEKTEKDWSMKNNKKEEK